MWFCSTLWFCMCFLVLRVEKFGRWIQLCLTPPLPVLKRWNAFSNAVISFLSFSHFISIPCFQCIQRYVGLKSDFQKFWFFENPIFKISRFFLRFFLDFLCETFFEKLSGVAGTAMTGNVINLLYITRTGSPTDRIALNCLEIPWELLIVAQSK